MSKEDKQIAILIEQIAHKRDGQLRWPIMHGVVKSVNEDTGTCVVLLTVNDDEAPTEGIMLSAVSMNSNGFILYPAVGSNVVVGEVDGPGKWCLLKCSNLTKVHLNGDSLGGLTKTLELKTQINKLNSLVTHLVAVINGAAIPEPGSGASSALQIALKAAITADSVGDFSNIENINVKHG